RILYNGGTFNGGISVTSAVYTSVTDTVYEKNAGISSPSSYVLDTNKNILYGGDGHSLYKYNSQTFNLLERRSVEYTSNYYDILLD
ncbi:hypothetical protein, partial [Lysinibacillus sp. GbtcB16]|uniref:hypothetical protein n=1 Tax=Lysinibacillus sp. GbtcB16 TaxID=2824761 RepID=UPI001C2FD8B3